MIEKGMPIEKANKQMERINAAFPDAMVTNYEELISTLSLPDKKDCHVLAAAIKSDAHLIVTNNLKDFDSTYLARFGLYAKSADDFLTDTIDLNTAVAKEAFMTMVAHRTNPSLDAYQVLDILRNRGLINAANSSTASSKIIYPYFSSGRAPSGRAAATRRSAAPATSGSNKLAASLTRQPPS